MPIDTTLSETNAAKAHKPTPTPTPTPVPPTVLPFVNQFTVSKTNFVSTLQPHIGQKTPRGKFAPPTQATQTNLRLFIQALHDYENAPSADLMTKLNGLMKSLDISAIRLQESPNDCVIFYPNPTKDANTPIVCGVTITWRFGAVQVPGNAATYNNIPQMFIFDPHSGQDGTIQTVTTQFMTGAKGIVSHYFNPNVAPNPNYKGGQINAGNIKRFSDPAHSDTTAFVPAVKGIYQVFPKASGTISHGMVGKPNFQLIANNDYKAHFLSNGEPSFCALLTIAMAIETLPPDTSPSFPINPNVVVVEGSVPGYIMNQGAKVPLISATNRASPVRLNSGIGDNSDCIGHMANGASDVFNLGTQTDKVMFIEFGPNFRGANSHLMKIFAAAQKNAQNWYMQYDPTIHDPWQLAKRFPDVYNNMALYPKLYDQKFIAEYKANGTNPFKTSSATMAQADMTAGNLGSGLRNAVVGTTEVADDLSGGSEEGVVAIPAVASKPMTFSASAARLNAPFSGFFDQSHGAKENVAQNPAPANRKMRMS